MGKTAVMAKLYERYATKDQKNRIGDRWAFHFCMQADGGQSCSGHAVFDRTDL